MIGTGIFLVPSDIAQEVSSASVVLPVWLAGGIIVLCGAFCYAEQGAAMPQAAGDYVYPSRGLGPVVAQLGSSSTGNVEVDTWDQQTTAEEILASLAPKE